MCSKTSCATGFSRGLLDRVVDCLVIGGGLRGLVAAHAAWHAGASVLVLDGGGQPGGWLRARSHCYFELPLIHFMPDSLRLSVPLFLKRQCDQTLGRLAVASRPSGRPRLGDIGAPEPPPEHGSGPFGAAAHEAGPAAQLAAQLGVAPGSARALVGGLVGELRAAPSQRACFALGRGRGAALSLRKLDELILVVRQS